VTDSEGNPVRQFAGLGSFAEQMLIHQNMESSGKYAGPLGSAASITSSNVSI
jgi:hypothetical protein